MAPDIIERLKASALSSALTIYPMPDPSSSNDDSLKLQTSYSSEEGVVAGHSRQLIGRRQRDSLY